MTRFEFLKMVAERMRLEDERQEIFDQTFKHYDKRYNFYMTGYLISLALVLIVWYLPEYENIFISFAVLLLITSLKVIHLIYRQWRLNRIRSKEIDNYAAWVEKVTNSDNDNKE